MTNEPPQGLRANIQRSLDLMISEEVWEEFEAIEEKSRWKKIYLGLFFSCDDTRTQKIRSIGLEYKI